MRPIVALVVCALSMTGCGSGADDGTKGNGGAGGSGASGGSAAKAAAEAQAGRAQTTLLLPATTDVGWWHEHVWDGIAPRPGVVVEPLSGRVRFLRPDGTSAGMPNFGSALVTFLAQFGTVASLVIPDTLQVNPAAPAGFPNGRKLDDQVIDITLAAIFLRMGASCGTGTCTAATLASAPLNPPANDATFSTTFPYLAAPHPAP